MGFFMLRKDNKDKNNTPDAGEKRNDDNDIRVVSQKLIVPLKIQACERLLLYIERIQFPLLVKRIFYPGISRDDFHFSMLQNVQDEFEHNLAQRLYVSEETWMLVTLAKEEARLWPDATTIIIRIPIPVEEPSLWSEVTSSLQ